jgi:hypothetical protein
MNQGTAINRNPPFNLHGRSDQLLDINQMNKRTVLYFESRRRPNKLIQGKRPLLVTAKAKAEHLID